MSRRWRTNYNVVNLYNGMTTVRNALVDLARDSSTVASNYRDIQRLNNAILDALKTIEVEKTVQPMEPYEDNRDTIDITPKQLMEEIILKDI